MNLLRPPNRAQRRPDRLENTSAPRFGRLGRAWRRAPGLAMLATLLVGAVLSAFMNNTPIVVLMLPMLIGATLRGNSPSSGVLLPMGLATIIGGMSTTIGTSTNLLVVSVAADMGMSRFSMFDFLVPAAMAGGLGLVYLWLVAPKLIPERRPPMSDASKRVFGAQLIIRDGGPFAGSPLSELFRKAGSGFQLTRVLREPNHLLSPLPDLTLLAGDGPLLEVERRTRLERLADTLAANMILDVGAKQELLESRILDERARELAFEGERFYDLMRVAQRRNDPSFLAKAVSEKFPSGQREAIYNLLLDENNLYINYFDE